ncbi:MAG TPA: serine/threonine-protein kinase [Candidatus Polarisedimenticolaceae bacterium]|nr:serine/threonine-protein kinase [Candidatus Polarisedimenticolaceae bacterium]
MREPAEALAVQIADGTPVDWDEAARGAVDRRVLRQLRLVESISQVHRSFSGSQPTPTETHDLPPAHRWGPLQLREKLGEGAYGEVYRAFDPRLEREVALKLLKETSAEALREGRLLAKLRHPHVVAVHGAEVHEGRTGLWMELIRGRSLEQALRQAGPLGPREAALVGIDLCRALAAVHGAGVLHRDVKAENVLREEGGRILLADFGAGLDRRAEAQGERSLSGTPYYMAPELFTGSPASERTDLYALGILLYRLVTASFPVQAATWEELRGKHARREATLLRDRRPELPEAFVAAVERATAWDPAARFATAGQMEQALAATLGAASQPVAPAPRRGALVPILLASVLVVAGAVLVAFLAQRRQPAPGVLPPPMPAGSVPAVPATYTVEAALWRVPRGGSAKERLEPGAQLALGDQLTLEFQASTPLHVYVVNEDEAGHAYALFPLPGLTEQNPLAPGARHVLPGARAGTAESISWVVDSPGGREHLVVLASPARLTDFEAEMNALMRPGESAVALPDAARVRLRGIGSLATSKPVPPTTGDAGRIFEMAERLAARSEVAQGVWMRQIELSNPKP